MLSSALPTSAMMIAAFIYMPTGTAPETTQQGPNTGATPALVLGSGWNSTDCSLHYVDAVNSEIPIPALQIVDLTSAHCRKRIRNS